MLEDAFGTGIKIVNILLVLNQIVLTGKKKLKEIRKEILLILNNLKKKDIKLLSYGNVKLKMRKNLIIKSKKSVIS